jgi:hypothetical protein
MTTLLVSLRAFVTSCCAWPAVLYWLHFAFLLSLVTAVGWLLFLARANDHE